ncbi:TPA: metallophosphoesterase, partial [Vibrio cholerae]|nr:metallophosphoesterase [Vibrio cholerae]
MEAMKILVISDLHVGEGAICTDLSIGTGQNAVKQNFLSELKALASRESLEADYLLVTGDITDRALPEEFALAAKKIKEIAGFFNISDVNRILFVPGNHDSNWAEEKRVLEINSSDIDLAIREKYRSIKDEPMFESILRNTNYGCFYKEPYFTIWEFEDLNVVGI